ncbi:polysaccharide biosynthesis protein [Pelagibacteraceae bacterium]|nr:polysaccharide biosynthesis protein [Pelagibacteraceae bacterium]
MFKDKTILITGGTGSFGSSSVSALLKHPIKELRIFSRDEKKQEDLRLSLGEKNKKVKFFLGDIRDPSSINLAIKDVNFIFHAAALKQVPSCEFYPYEAVKTNIIGTENIIQSAVANDVEKLVILSTDKAVYPINAMGISKSMAEKIAVANARLLNNKKTTICITRYGNVMGSRGSVIPLFIDQIKKKKNITITNKDMTRFLMSLEESINLVLYAFKHGKQGDLFIQKSPACTIQNLVLALSEIFKVKPKIKYIGTRHGEKLFETLISKEEIVRAKDLGKYYKIPADNRDLNYNSFFSEGREVFNYDDYNSHNTNQLNKKQIIDLLLKLDFVRSAQNA